MYSWAAPILMVESRWRQWRKAPTSVNLAAASQSWSQDRRSMRISASGVSSSQRKVSDWRTICCIRLPCMKSTSIALDNLDNLSGPASPIRRSFLSSLMRFDWPTCPLWLYHCGYFTTGLVIDAAITVKCDASSWWHKQAISKRKAVMKAKEQRCCPQ